MNLLYVLLVGTGLAQTSPPSGTLALQNDGHQSGDMVGFQSGFYDNECWASTYVPDPSYYPIELHSVDMLVYGSSPSGFYTFKVMTVDSNNKPLAVIADTYISMQSSTTSLSRIEMATSKWLNGLPPFEFTKGENFAVAVCIDDLNDPLAESSYPQISRDTDGNNYHDRNWIYDTNGNWVQSFNYLVLGDWLMRANVLTAAAVDTDTDTDTDSDTDTDTDTDSDVDVLLLNQVIPDSMPVGEAVDVVLIGSGFDVDAEATVGGLNLTGIDVLNDETINGRVPSSLPVGFHDVEVINPDGDSVYYTAAFEVFGEDAEDKSRGCVSSGAVGSTWAWLGVVLVVAGRRRT
ncbi:MAG: hypothetical protein HN348_10380 [Proteobacteria bacterium]|jgi:hypothetical protein|nr:hypothetical protein [Pseudomonadota bacterium]